MPVPGDHELTLTVDGRPRQYLLHAPPNYDPGTPMPLVLALHARPSTAKSMRSFTRLSDKADEAGFLVVYPQALGGVWNNAGVGTDDVGFISALIDEVERTWGTDPHRIYATGFSNGAQMTYRLAAELSDRLAAVAPISGAVRSQEIDPPASPISLLTITGTADVPVNSNAEDILTVWQRAMGCRTDVDTRDIGDRAVKTTHAKCDAGTEIVWHSVRGMGHSWPAGSLSANDTIWEFFEAHPR